MTKKQVDSKTLAEFCVKEAGEKKALDIVSLKVSELTTIADYFVLCMRAKQKCSREILF